MEFYCKFCDKEWNRGQLLPKARCPECFRFVNFCSKTNFDIQQLQKLQYQERKNKYFNDLEELKNTMMIIQAQLIQLQKQQRIQ